MALQTSTEQIIIDVVLVAYAVPDKKGVISEVKADCFRLSSALYESKCRRFRKRLGQFPELSGKKYVPLPYYAVLSRYRLILPHTTINRYTFYR